MNAKTSFFNKKIYTKSLIQGLPFMLLLSAFMILYFVGAINSDLSYFEYENLSHANETKQLQYTLYTYSCDAFFKFLMSCYSFIFGIFVFRYFYNKKLCGTIHSLPLTRTCLYVSNTLSGLTMLVLPFLLTAVVIGIYMLVLGYSISHLPLWIVVMLGYCLIFYALAILTAMLTGHLVSAPIVYCFLNFGILVAQVIIQVCISLFYFGVPSEINSNYYILTPFAYLLEYLHAPTLAPAYGETMAVTFAKEGIKGIIIYAIVSVVILVISWYLYRVRKLETQGDPIVSKKIQPVLLYLATALCASVLSGILYGIFFYSWDSGYYTDTRTITAIIVIFLICSVLCYFILAMLLKKTVHVFKGKHKGLIVYLGIVLLAFLVIRLDLLNVEGNVPKPEDITSVEVYYDCNTSEFENKEAIENITNMHKEIIDNKAQIIEAANGSWDEAAYGTDISLTYHLKNGKTLNRSYYVVVPASDNSVLETIAKKWKEFLHNSETMLSDLETTKKYVHYIGVTPSENYEPQTVISDTKTETAVSAATAPEIPIYGKDMDTLFEAMVKDIKSEALKTDTFYNSNYDETKESAIYYVYVDSWSEDGDNYHDYSRNYVVTKDCSNTKELLDQFAVKYYEQYTEETTEE